MKAKADKQFTVIGKYPNGKTVVAHVECAKASDARRRAVQKIAFQVYDGKIPEGLGPINEAIRAVSKDFCPITVLDGHHKPNGSAKRYLFHQ